MLRLSQDGHGLLEVVGTQGIGSYLHALRHFVRWLHPKVVVTECQHVQAGEVVYEDDTITVFHHLHQQCVVSERKRHRVEGLGTKDTGKTCHALSQPMEKASFCLPVTRSDLHGRLDAFFAQQQQGGTSQVNDGMHIHRKLLSDAETTNLAPFSDESVSLFCKQAERRQMEPSSAGSSEVSDLLCFEIHLKSLGSSLLFVDCKDVAALSAFENNQNLSALQSAERGCCAIFHFTKHTLCTSTRYQAVFGKFASQVRQIFLDKGPTSSTLGHHSALRTTWKLHMVSKEHFPVPYQHSQGRGKPEAWDLELLEKYIIKPGMDSTHPIVESGGLPCGELNDTSAVRTALFEEKTDLEQHLRRAREKLESIPPAILSGACTNKDAAQKLREKLYRGACAADPATLPTDKVRNMVQQGPSIVFLGTGCAEPSKYRASSGILVRMDCGRGLLMDAGEGTWGQFVRFFGPSMAERVVNDLEIIWISHKHADHILGILSIVAHRTATAPLHVVCPGQVRSWLEETMPLQGSSCKLVHCEHFAHNQSLAHRAALERLGLKEWSSFRVIHCEQSYGLVVKHADGWKLVYSGDTRPCRNLQIAARDATVLIHEATFEEELKSHALRKKHCTWREALEAGRLCNVQALVLTHFSQRYPKVPALEGPSDILDRTLVAFDGLHLPLSDITRVAALMQGIRLVLDPPSLPPPS